MSISRGWLRLAGLAGIVYVASSAVGNTIEPTPPSLNADPSTIVLFVTTHRHQIIEGEIIVIVATLIGLWWLGTVSFAFSKVDGDNDPLGWIAIITGVCAAIFGFLGHLATGLLALLENQPQGLTSGSLDHALLDLSQMSIAMRFVLIGVFAPTLAFAAWRRAVIGRWFVWLSIVVGAVAAAAGGIFLATGTFVTFGSALGQTPSTSNALIFMAYIGYAIVVVLLSIQFLRVRRPIPTTDAAVEPTRMN